MSGRSTLLEMLNTADAAEIVVEIPRSTRRVSPLDILPMPVTIPAAPGVRVVDPTSLQIEASYQRDLLPQSQRLIRKIVTGWNWAKFKPPICADHGGSLFVIDGQNTAIAAATLGIKAMPVLVVSAEKEAQRADAFVSHNRDRMAMSPFQIFHASVVAGDKTAIGVMERAKKTGATIPRSTPPRGRERPGQIIAISEIMRTAHQHGLDIVERLFRIAVSAQCAPLGRNATRSLRILLTERYFSETAKMVDSRIANGLRSISGFEIASRHASDAAGTSVGRAGAGLIKDACDRQAKC